jgi:RimJ/RimL family protein N-acetyltransferase
MENSVVSWCISGNHFQRKCEVTIGTDEKYQNKGCATLTTSAFIERCISKNLTPSWHCGYDNHSSIAVAQKVGFEKTLMYPVYCWAPTTRTDLFWLMKNKLKKLIPTSSFHLDLETPNYGF